jgi:PadR family transcriptional regulator, regulatory protein PadR
MWRLASVDQRWISVTLAYGRPGSSRPKALATTLEIAQGLDNAKISSYCARMRRKEGALVPLEVSILEIALELRSRGIEEAHGFLLAKELRDGAHARRLTAYGTLYKALDRLERAGDLASRWEDPQLAAEEGRPRRRFYRVTLTGEAALAEAISAESEDTLPRSAAVQPS